MYTQVRGGLLARNMLQLSYNNWMHNRKQHKYYIITLFESKLLLLQPLLGKYYILCSVVSSHYLIVSLLLFPPLIPHGPCGPLPLWSGPSTIEINFANHQIPSGTLSYQIRLENFQMSSPKEFFLWYLTYM